MIFLIISLQLLRFASLGRTTGASFDTTQRIFGWRVLCGIRPRGRAGGAATVAPVTNEEFEALVARLEGEAKRSPGGYKTRVVLMALLGNAYLGVMLVLIVALLLAAIVSIAWLKGAGVKIALVLGVFLWMVLKALWIRLEPPQGAEVTAREAPELFAMIEELRRALRAPRFHHVLVTDEFNAGVVQAPRLGFFGWSRNYLLIGLPLAKGLTVEQFKAVLAHEFGHLARGHGRLSNWIYSQRLRWGRLMAVLEEAESAGRFLFRPFLRWYAPYFNACSYPLARANEFEADATSARLVSKRSAAEALTAVNVVGSYLEERYWPQIHRRADELPQPAFAPYSSMGAGVAREIDPASVENWLAQALARKTTVDDTHPCLTERLEALAEKPALALPAAGAAADRLLGPALERITREFDQRWHDGILPSWQERHREVQEARGRLAELDAKHASGGELTLQEAYDRALLTESPGGDAEGCIAQLRALHERAGDEPVLHYTLGVRLLARDDESGVALLKRAMQRDESETVRCCEALRDYCWRKERKDEAHDWHRRMVERAELEQAAKLERDQVRTSDKFERHGLEPQALAQLEEQVKSVAGLRKAYFVRKRVKHMPERVCYVFGYTVGSLFRWHTKARAAEVMAAIQAKVSFPGETLILCVEGDNRAFGGKFRWMRGSRIL
jgi:Zn-dependent protease with chaperone function